MDDALQLLEENESGRAALLPLNDHQRHRLFSQLMRISSALRPDLSTRRRNCALRWS